MIGAYDVTRGPSCRPPACWEARLWPKRWPPLKELRLPRSLRGRATQLRAQLNARRTAGRARQSAAQSASLTAPCSLVSREGRGRREWGGARGSAHALCGATSDPEHHCRGVERHRRRARRGELCSRSVHRSPISASRAVGGVPRPVERLIRQCPGPDTIAGEPARQSGRAGERLAQRRRPTWAGDLPAPASALR